MIRVHVTINGCEKKEAWIEQRPKHKKNAELGSKNTTFGPLVYLEQEDAQSFDDNEEVILLLLVCFLFAFIIMLTLLNILDHSYGLGKCYCEIERSR